MTVEIASLIARRRPQSSREVPTINLALVTLARSGMKGPEIEREIRRPLSEAEIDHLIATV